MMLNNHVLYSGKFGKISVWRFGSPGKNRQMSWNHNLRGTWSTMRLGLHRSGDVTFGGWRSRITKFILTKIKKYTILAEIIKFSSH